MLRYPGVMICLPVCYSSLGGRCGAHGAPAQFGGWNLIFPLLTDTNWGSGQVCLWDRASTSFLNCSNYVCILSIGLYHRWRVCSLTQSSKHIQIALHADCMLVPSFQDELERWPSLVHRLDHLSVHDVRAMCRGPFDQRRPSSTACSSTSCHNCPLLLLNISYKTHMDICLASHLGFSLSAHLISLQNPTMEIRSPSHLQHQPSHPHSSATALSPHYAYP